MMMNIVVLTILGCSTTTAKAGPTMNMDSVEVTFDTFRKGTLKGPGWNLGMPNGQKQMASDYKITRVKLSLKWKDQGWGNQQAALNLWRGVFRPGGRLDSGKGDHVIAALNLARYQRSRDKDGMNTVQRTFTPDDGSFWQRGEKGEWLNLYYNSGGEGSTITFYEMKVEVSLLVTTATSSRATDASATSVFSPYPKDDPTPPASITSRTTATSPTTTTSTTTMAATSTSTTSNLQMTTATIVEAGDERAIVGGGTEYAVYDASGVMSFFFPTLCIIGTVFRAIGVLFDLSNL